FLKVCKGVRTDKKTEMEIETKDHDKTFFLIHAPLKLTDKTYFIEELRNITKLKNFEKTIGDYTAKLEAEIKRRTEDLRKKVDDSEQARMALLNMMDELNNAYKSLEEEAIKKDELFNITSHELKTPLVPIAGFTDLLLKEECKLSPTEREYLMLIKKNVFRLKNILENVIYIARLQARKAEFQLANTDLAGIINTVTEDMEEQARNKNIKIMKSLGATKITCDKEKMKDVMRHLVDNAIKFNNIGGKINISTKKTDKSVTISIADTGIGISPENKEKIFEKFFQVDSSDEREVGGAGLGLPICKAVVEAHRGEMWVESHFGKGATFFVKLPLNLKEIHLRKTDIYNSSVELLERERRKLTEERMDLMTRL
ncbi:MAG: HAMP domain-containing histidine kinase, partial [Nanoarchaeota archaeon]|nr:HAMP domain-containing histidine kinase [Nanoarchaeota archaeon]